MLRSGRIPGSPSRAPEPTSHALPVFDSQGIRDPQTSQNALHQNFAVGGSKRRTCSSPAVKASWSAGTNRLAACAVPDDFRHRLQKQYCIVRNGGRISNCTAPQTQEPVMGASDKEPPDQRVKICT